MLSRRAGRESALLALFGRNIRDARELRGWSQRELCRRTKFDQSWISAVENGQANIGLLAIGKLARILTVEPADLLKPAAFGDPAEGAAPARRPGTKART